MNFALAWLIVISSGTGIVAIGYGIPRRMIDGLAMLGFGVILGMLFVAAIVGVAGPTASDRTFELLAWPLLACAVALWGAAWWMNRHNGAVPGNSPPQRERLSIPEMCIWSLLAVLICLHAWPLFFEELLRPVFPWDAWAAWMAKPKAWYLGGHFDRFVDPGQWLAPDASGLRTMPAWFYPEISGWLQLWFAAALGEWNESLLLLPWFALYAAFIVAFYVQCRRLAIPAIVSMAATYGFASMPLIDAHVALAGYLDLWVGCVLALTMSLWLQWRNVRSPRLLGLLIALAATLPFLKREGVIWLAGVVAIAILGEMPRRLHRWGIALGAALVVGGALAAGFGPAILRGDWISPDATGTHALRLAWHPGGLEPLIAMFSQGNWHLLGIGLVGATLWRWRALREHLEVRLVLWFLLGGLAFLIALFCFTPAAQWAERDTAGNRLVMHLVPCCLLYVALLWRGRKMHPA